jgi:hypothetical protein
MHKAYFLALITVLFASKECFAAAEALCGNKSIEAVVALGKINGTRHLDYSLKKSEVEQKEDLNLGTYTIEGWDQIFEVKTMEGINEKNGAVFCSIYSVVQVADFCLQY